MRRLYPVFLDVAGRKAVVIGGGAVASRKAASLIEAGAELTVISPETEPALTALISDKKARHIKRAYSKGDLEGAFIAIAATDDPGTNRLISEEAEGLGILVNCASPPSSGNFFVPSSINKGGLTVAISTGGACPALTKKLRIRLSETIGDEYGQFLEFLEEARAKLKVELPSEPDRASALEELVDSGLLEYFRDKPVKEAIMAGEKLLQAAIAKRKDRV